MRKQPVSRRRGIATVELAVVLPFLLFLFVIAVDFGRILYYSQLLTDSARAGALQSMYESDPNDPNDATRVFYELSGVKSPYASCEAAALAEAANLSPAPTITRSPLQTDPNGFKYYEVTVSWTFHTLTQYPAIPSSIPLQRTVRMRWVDPKELAK